MTPDEAWLRLLPTQRWFAGKGRPLAGVDVRPGAWCEGSGARLSVRPETIVVHYADGAVESYRALSAYRAVPADVAVADPAVEVAGGVRALSDATADPEAFDLVLRSLDLGPDMPTGEITPFPAEQSNTSVRIGTGALFKFLRRPDGPAREAELLAALGTSGVTPRLYATAADPDGTTWAVVMEFVDATGDGWRLATRSCAAGEDFTGPAAELGRALRGVHALLDQAFGTVVRAGEGVRDGMLAQLDEVAAEVPAVAALADRIRPVYAGLADHELVCQQVHGDFHLGQVLRRREPAGWMIIDFEGEPLKTPAQRREPDSVWRDVAGALRSFDYARSAHPDPASPQARNWSSAARSAFLAGYLGDDVAPATILAAYLIDKAVYEVRYEIRNRPDWAPIPLAAIVEELAGLDAPATDLKEQ